uniref:Uncharacterized protein n=1 Tax=Trypanosoma congolense (strain IL3000) TaxID=1068625 RepID=G0UQA5_TRYCI|nr:hypothetical protein, unlikely [Trypanosoma congolense IL3000]
MPHTKKIMNDTCTQHPNIIKMRGYYPIWRSSSKQVSWNNDSSKERKRKKKPFNLLVRTLPSGRSASPSSNVLFVYLSFPFFFSFNNVCCFLFYVLIAPPHVPLHVPFTILSAYPSLSFLLSKFA